VETERIIRTLALSSALMATAGTSASAQAVNDECVEISLSPADAWDDQLESLRLEPDRRPIRHLSLNSPVGMRLWRDYIDAGPDGEPVRIFTDEDGDGVPDGREDRLNASLGPGANGVPDAFDELLGSLTFYADMGYERILLREPGGDIVGQPMSSAHWWTMPEWKRDGFKTHIAAWIDANPDVSVGVYAGWRLVAPCTTCTISTAPGCPAGVTLRTPQPGSTTDARDMYANLRPWLDVGIREYWFDGASGSESELLYFADDAPADYGALRFGGEAIPHVQSTDAIRPSWTPTDQRFVNMDAVLVMAWMAQPDWHSWRVRDPFGRPRPVYAEARSEIHLLADRNDAGPLTRDERVAMAVDHLDRNIIPGSASRLFDEAVIRSQWPIYADSFNLDFIHANRWQVEGFFCPADLDMDGVVGSRDLALLLANWGREDAALLYGELSGDGVIDSRDLSILLAQFGALCP